MKITKNQVIEFDECKECTAYLLDPFDPQIARVTMPMRQGLVEDCFIENVLDCYICALIPHGSKTGYIVVQDLWWRGLAADNLLKFIRQGYHELYVDCTISV